MTMDTDIFVPHSDETKKPNREAPQRSRRPGPFQASSHESMSPPKRPFQHPAGLILEKSYPHFVLRADKNQI